jgi:uncharacterized Zn finger protein
MREIVSIEKFDIIVHDSGVIENIAKKGQVIGLEDVKNLIETNVCLTKNTHYAALIDLEELSSFTKDAMNYTADRKTSPKIIARALMVNDLAKRIIGNFYIKVVRPQINTKLFTERQKAIAWLEEQLTVFKNSQTITDKAT